MGRAFRGNGAKIGMPTFLLEWMQAGRPDWYFHNRLNPRVRFSDYLCNLRYDSGKFAVGGEKSDRYFYTSQYRTCMRFSYYGSLGNENNFPDYNSCMRTCGTQ
ncbi:hypothetical protein Y032_0085g1810 [Ancylostoma ceylanicum]|uniref:BPTI/Kunitz inhibitor domain-containing protein n=1 Tax=Ancylostoma ceylanicum TaxID=53326 RepID=A0A016TQU2_9BILA|nr:hypothetical protein Y032_0085g1810 [Ancylostoma ceylanicum]